MGIVIAKNEIIVPSGYVLLEIYNVITKKTDREFVRNLITTAGKNAIADGLRGTTTNNKGIITYCALGTDSTAPDAADTALGTEIERKLISVRSVADNIATFQTFFTTAEGVGTLREAALFGDNASGTADSGTLFAKTAISRTKTANDTLTLSWSITVG